MTPTTIIALFCSMTVLALIPGPGVFTVMARSMSSGIRHGAATVAGIVVGDYVFILLSVLGLAAIAEVASSFFMALKYAGAAYLIWLAISLWRSDTRQTEKIQGIRDFSIMSNFAAGLLTTLGNPKAILFYAGFFPAFLDLTSISLLSLTVIIAVATISIGGVMMSYAWVASKTDKILSSKRSRINLNRTAGGVMACSGILLATKA